MKFQTLLLGLFIPLNIFSELVRIEWAQDKSINNNFIVHLRSDTRNTLESHLDDVNDLINKNRSNSINKINQVYKNLGKVYYATLDNVLLNELRKRKDIDFIEQDKKATLDTVQTNAPYGLARISQRAFKNLNTYTYDGDGSGVTVYMVDSGILLNHTEFEGRAQFGKRFTNDQDNDEDGIGHGTHTAGTVGSKTYGVSKKVNLVAVKVLDKNGNGNFSNILDALNWIIQDKRGIKGNVISMSLGGPISESIDKAIESAYQKGFVIVVSAGNNSKDACLQSPASSPNAITVAASTWNDLPWDWTNFGKCVDLYAPGHLVLSTWNDGKTDVLSGTSMSAPHVAGLAAYFLSKENLTNKQVIQKILSSATKDAIQKNKPDTPNLLAYNNII